MDCSPPHILKIGVKKLARTTTKLFNTTPEDLKLINPDNMELIEDFMQYYSATDHSEKSMKVTRSNLNIFFVWLAKKRKNIDFCKIKKKDILAFQSYLMSADMSPSRIRALKSSLSSLSKYIEDMLDEDEKWENFKNIVNKVPNPVLAPVRVKTMLEDSQIEELLDFLVSKGQYQKACVLALAWASGARKSELLRFKMSYITDENLRFGGALYMTPEKMKTQGRGKQGKMIERYVLADKFKKYYDLWAEERERLGVPKDVDYMFITKSDGKYVPMQESTLDSYAKTFSRFLNCDFYMHSLRHNFTTGLLRAGIPAEVVKELVGWASVDMVGVYDDRPKDEVLGKYFTDNGIQIVESKGLGDL